MSLTKGTTAIVDGYKNNRLVAAAYKNGAKVFDAYTEITAPLPLSFNSRAAGALKNYRLYGDSDGSGVETENLVDVSMFTNGYTLDGTTGLPTYFPDRIATTLPIDVSNVNSVVIQWSDKESKINGSIYSIFNGNTLISRVAGVVKNTVIDVSSATSIYLSLYTFEKITTDDFNYIMITEGSTAPDHYIPHGYKIPILNTSGVTENLWDGNYEHAVLSGSSLTEYKFVTSINGRTAIIPCEPNTTYIIKKYSESNRLIIADSANRPNDGDVCDLIANQYAEVMEAQVTTHIDAHWMSIYVSTSSEQAEPNITVTEGSTAPDHYIPHRYTSNYDLFIGNSKLGEEEYLDYQEQKVWKRTENLWNPNTPFTEGKYIAGSGGLGTDIGWRASDYVNVDSNKQYTFYVNTTAAPAACHAFYDSNKRFISSMNSGTQAFITPNNAAYARFSYRTFTAYIMLVEGSTVPETYIPYLQPTDPPVPLPAIQTYQGENTLSSTETVGEVTVKGRIKEAVPNG